MKPSTTDLQQVAAFLDPSGVGELPDPDTCQRVGKFLKQLVASGSVPFTEPGWFLPLSAINDIQAKTVAETVSRARGAHHTDVDMRINGRNEMFQADWIKHMVRVDATPALKCDGNHGGPRCADPECWNDGEPKGAAS